MTQRVITANSWHSLSSTKAMFLLSAEICISGVVPHPSPFSLFSILKRKEDGIKSYLLFIGWAQASEKIYKAAENTVKILAKTHTPDIYHEAETRGRWTVSLLDKAVRAMESILGEDAGVGRGWDAAMGSSRRGLSRAETGCRRSQMATKTCFIPSRFAARKMKGIVPECNHQSIQHFSPLPFA